MDKNEEQLANQCPQLGFNTTATSALSTKRNESGLDLTWKLTQIDSYNRKLRNSITKMTAKTSTAALLLETFEARDDVNFLYVTYNPTESLMILSSTT